MILARHGEAEDTAPTGRDADRKLTDSGKEGIQRMAEFIRDSGMPVSKIFYSPYTRTIQTADIYSEILGVETTPLECLLPGSDYYQLCFDIRNESNSTTFLIVAHNPGLAHFAEQLLGVPGISQNLLYTPGAACAINVAREKFHHGQIIWFLSPQFLRKPVLQR